MSPAARASALAWHEDEDFFSCGVLVSSAATMGGTPSLPSRPYQLHPERERQRALNYTVPPAASGLMPHQGTATALTPLVYVINAPPIETEAPLVESLPRRTRVLRVGVKPLRRLEPRRPNIIPLLLAADEE